MVAGVQADPSFSAGSVEANDAKTGVHCPRLRGNGAAAARGTERRRREPGGSYVPTVDPCIPTFPAAPPILPRKEENGAWACSYGNGKEGRGNGRGAGTGNVDAAVDLIFKCKQIYIVAKAPPTTSRALTENPTTLSRYRPRFSGPAKPPPPDDSTTACRIFFSIIQARREGTR